MTQPQPPVLPPASGTDPEMPAGSPQNDQPSGLPPEITAKDLQQQQRVMIGIIAVVVVILVLTVASVWLLLLPTTDTERIRDVFIIMIAALTLIMGFVLVLLIIQLARLINLLQNEIRPILESTNETSRTLRGTAVFLSDNLSEPVIKLNEYMAAMQRFMEMINPGRSRK
jgi:hypothetical protein